MRDCGTAIPLADKRAWDDVLARLPHAFGHTWDSCHAMQQTTHHPTFLYHYRSASAECACPFSVRTFQGREDVYTPYGFSGFCGIGDSNEMAEAWHRFATGRGFVCGYIGLNPLLAPEAFRGSLECSEIGDLYFLDLEPEPDALLQAMSRGRRRQIVRWEHDGRPLLDDQPALAEFFCANLVPFLLSHGAPATYAFSPDTLRQLLEAPSTLLLGAGSLGAIEAVTLFAHSPLIGEHMFIVCAPGGERHTAALTWAGALALRERGVRWLSMGGGVTPGDGIAEQKQRFGALRMAKRVLKQVYDQQLFDELAAPFAGGDGIGSGYFPPYQRRALDVP